LGKKLLEKVDGKERVGKGGGGFVPREKKGRKGSWGVEFRAQKIDSENSGTDELKTRL